MSEVEKQPESTAPEQKAAPAGAAAAAPVAEKAARSGKKLSTKIRLIVELAALVLALVVICIVGEVKNLKWWCYMRASLGSAEMQYKLGENCANENPKEAAEWFRKAAAQGHPKAAHRLVETTDDNEEKIKLLLPSAEKGDARTQFDLARIYRQSGKMAEAVKWYEKAAAGGIPDAQHELGVLYYDGTGVEKDLAKAKELIKKAADQGFARSINKLQDIENAEKGN